MNGSLFLQKRSKRHMARLMEAFETMVVPHLQPSANGDVDRFKGMARDTIKNLTSDGCDVIDALQNGEVINEAAAELRERAEAAR